MADPLEITADVTREDWLAANEWLIQHGPYWEEVARQYRRKIFVQSLWMVPVIGLALGIAALRNIGFVWGALIGGLFGLFMAFGLSRVDVVAKAKAQALDQLRRMDLSAHMGRTSASMDESGVRITTPVRELKLSWTAVTPHDVGDFLMFSHGSTDGTVIPKRVFPSPEDAAAFYQQAVEWWRAGQLPAAERIARYLADRDVACPRCAYNLRGIRAETCPECGEGLTVERLVGAKQ